VNSNKGGDWTGEEISRFINRENKLMAQGMSAVEASSLAERLVYRDRTGSGDDRKLCLECCNWSKGCTVPMAGYCTVPTVLQCCDGFMARANNGGAHQVAIKIKGVTA